MKHHTFLLFTVIFGTCGVFAQDFATPVSKPLASADIAALEVPYKATIQAVSEDSAKWQAALRTWYVAGLNKLLVERKTAGDLDGAVAVKAETDRVVAGTETTVEQINSMPGSLRKQRGLYDAQLKRIADEVAARTLPAQRKHLANLEALQTRITKGGDLEQALLVKAEKERFAAEIPPASVPPPAPAPTAIASTGVPKAQATPTKPESGAMGIGKPTLREALLNWKWSWTGKGNETDVFLTFLPNGTVSHRGMAGKWKIQGENKIQVVENGGRTLILKFDDSRESYQCILGAPDLHGHRIEKKP